MSRPQVLILYNEPMGDPGSVFQESDEGVRAEAAAVEEACRRLGVATRSAMIRQLEEIPPVVASGSEPVIFNLVESLSGGSEDACLVPAVCRSLGRAVTGADTPCLTLTLDKCITKGILRAWGIPTPDWRILHPGAGPGMDFTEPFPAIVKPLRADASEGIDADSVVRSPGEACERAVQRIWREFDQPALIERYIDGREFNASVLQEGSNVRVLPVAEIVFSDFRPDRSRIVDYSAKWKPGSFEYEHTKRRVPTELPRETEDRIHTLALESWYACRCRDYARVDFRMSSDGLLQVLEVNANPDIAPDAGFAAALRAAGVEYSVFVKTLLVNAGLLGTNGPIMRAAESSTVSETSIRKTRKGDIPPILQLLRETRLFRPDEVAVASEVLLEALEAGSYESFTFESDGAAVGWICYGQTPCTVATFDTYWLAVSPAFQGRGIGKKLMQFAEQRIHEAGGRLIIVETAGRGDYDPTRRFYERIGYLAAHRIRDYYAPGDDKVIYTKDISDRRTPSL